MPEKHSDIQDRILQALKKNLDDSYNQIETLKAKVKKLEQELAYHIKLNPVPVIEVAGSVVIGTHKGIAK